MTETLNERLKSPIPIRELERRTAALQQAMKAEGIDCVIAQNITQYLGGCNRWLTDTTAENNYPQSSILPAEGAVRYIACSGPPLDLYPPSHLLRIGQVERENTKQRQAEGIRIAKEKGIKFGRPPIPIPKEFEEIYKLWKVNKISKRKAAKMLNTNHNTFSNWIKRYEKNAETTRLSCNKK